MRSGVILEFVWGTKRLVSSDTYKITVKGTSSDEVFDNLEEEEFFDIMENLAQKFYETGSPQPSDIQTEIIGD